MTRTHRGPALKILLLLLCALQKCLACNESLYGLTGSLFSPNYPQTSGVCSCSWNITVPVGYRVRLTFVHVNVACAYGGIEFIDKGVVRKLCDSGIQTTVSEVPHRQVQVKYYSNSSQQAHGFFAHFKAISLSGANETTCPTGFQEYSNACYHTEKLSSYLYNDRLDYCKSRESSLLSIEDTQENLFAVASLALLTPQKYLLLGMDKNSTGDYVWRDGSPLIHTNWKSGHPTKQGRPKLEENGEWSDGIVPEYYFVFVCKKKLSGPSLPCNVTQLSRGILKLEASHVTGHSQWSVTVKNNEHWLQVDFNEVMISGIAITSYDAMKSNWIRNLTLAFSRYGNVFVPYTNPMKQIVVLQANRDPRNIVMNNLANPFIARNVRLYPDQWNNGINVDVRLYGCVLSPPADKCDLPLGVGSGAVSDAMITSSDSSPSRFDARLNLDLGLATAWLPSKPTNQWIQFKFDVRMTISGIATQGNSNGAWVTKYYVLYSAESPFSHMVLRFVKEYGTDQPKVFIGNTNQMSVARQTFKMPITTHTIRVLPVAYHGRAAMRLELYGCQSAFTPLPPHCGKPVRIVDLPVKTTTKFSSGTLNLDDGWFWETRNTTNPWIQVRLKMQMNITALETKGSIQYGSWVTNYTLQYSSNGGQLQDFKYKGESVNFVGNVDGSSIIHHELSTPFLADTVRLSPTGWFGDRISLTMKLYECSALDHQGTDT
ncbi:uncharacterized protein LOC125568394 [Nematostella vectensis]|uniref:uncharacterized protein LOC125568394 n=1 Tax=Nematostella vectensis TaxID=45351 RepID=UPI0020773EDB|nr:uncharacterized protein LOC125568394 [Nematostella vectensis]